MLSVGDNFYPYGIKSTDDPRWETTFVNAYAAPGLQVPWHVALGNPYYRGSVRALIAYSEKSARWRMPALLFSFVEKTPAGVIAQFFVLDTCPFVPACVRAAIPMSRSRTAPRSSRGSTWNSRRRRPTGKFSSATTRSGPAASGAT